MLMKEKTKVALGAAQNTPGEILFEEFMEPLGLSVRELARRMGCDPSRVSAIVRGKRSITADTSLMLGKALGVSPQFWIGIQCDHDLAKSALKHPELV